ncbi:MAG: BON domain-containing protein [Cyanobacteria bacterium J06592_8]
MTVSKKESGSSQGDSVPSPADSSRASEEVSEKVDALDPLLDLLLDLQVLQGQTSASSETSSDFSDFNGSEKSQKKSSSSQSSASSAQTENTENIESSLEDVFEAVNPSPIESTEKTEHKSQHKSGFESLFDLDQPSKERGEEKEPNSEQSQPNEQQKTDSQSTKVEFKEQDSSDIDEFDLADLETLSEVPTDAVDVSYSVTPLEAEKAEKTGEDHLNHALKTDQVDENTKLSSDLKNDQKLQESDQKADPILEQLQGLIFGSTLSEFEQLKQQVTESNLPEVNQLLGEISAQLQSLEHQIYDPEQLMQLIRPWIAEILSYKVNESKEDVIQALQPIIDEIILAKARENREKMSAAIADLIPEAIRHQILNYPQEIAQAIAPEMGAAIREQIRLDQDEIADALAPTMGKAIKEQVLLERDAMVDALYPVIGNTITRYLGEAIREINDKVANALSLEGIQRKIQAKIQGVSEAELILQEVAKCTIKAVFLIHKSSGLIISEVQQSGEAMLESEMLAGMLTAIRSFVNDCIVQGEEIKELSEIEYGDSRILIEVAGYCYLAVILKGEIRKHFLQEIRNTLIEIIQKYGKEIETFEGDPETIPPEIKAKLEQLIERETQRKAQYSNQYPEILLAFAGVTVSIVILTWGFLQYRSSVVHRVKTEVTQALDSEPELAIYRLDVEAKGDIVTLNGKLPNQRLREKAETVVQETVPDWIVENDIIAVKIPPEPLLVEAEVKRMTETLNQINGISISTQYDPDIVRIEGKVTQPSDLEKVTQAFEKIEGVNSIVSRVEVEPPSITTRVYFNLNSPEFRSEDMIIKIYPLSQYLKQYPNLKIRIIGYSHPKEKFQRKSNSKSKLALQRAQVVKTALESYGIDRTRMKVEGQTERPPGVDENQPDWLSRTVIFEIIPQENNQNEE